MKNLRMDPKFAARNVNEGFSGGEKKRHEILQLELLKPAIAVLDETDSGLDVDALKIVSEGVNRAKEATDLGVLLITHYTRILRYIKPDFVHVLVKGRVAEEGGPELAERLEDEGYDRYPRAVRRGRSLGSTHDRDSQSREVRRRHRGAQGRHGSRTRDQRRRPRSHLRPLWDEENDALVIHMTLTSAGCPLTDVLEEQTAQARRRRRPLPHQLGVDAAVGPRAHHRRRRDMMRALGFAI
jgi:ABC-type multidrug transport system ATPase subunit